MSSSPASVSLIAEFCQNHNGNYETLARMVEAASTSGATHGKVQAIYANDLAFRPQFENGLKIGGNTICIKRPYRTEYDRLKELEMSEAEVRKFIQLCRDNGIIPMTTCFNRAQVAALAEFGFESIKVASYDCASFPMLRELATKFDKIYVSTGATYDHEIEHAAKILGNHEFIFLHCVTIYPTPLEEMNLARMDYLRGCTPNVGFSDHSLVSRDGISASKAAIYLGASVVERHFTILNPSETRDGPVSISPNQLNELSLFGRLTREEQAKQLDEEVPNWSVMIGNQHRRLSHAEFLNRDYYRGRFASRRGHETDEGMEMIFNWEETPLT